MPIEKLTIEEYRRLVQIIADMEIFQSIGGRRDVMSDAGLERFSRDMIFDSPAGIFAGALVRRLAEYGTLDGEPVLARLLRYLNEKNNNPDTQAFLITLLGAFGNQRPVAPPEVHQTSDRQERVNILIMSANVEQRSFLRLDLEQSAIDKAIQRATHRDRFNVEKKLAVRIDELQEIIRRAKPNIVHFAGHGDDAGSIVVFDKDNNSPYSVPILALCEIFRRQKTVRLVVLNACWSQPLAEALAEVVGCVVGMQGNIHDEDAIAFSEAFYSALADGESIGDAFDAGKTQLTLYRMSDSAVPQLMPEGVKPRQLYFA